MPELPRATWRGLRGSDLSASWSSVPRGEGHTVMLGLVAKGQECGGSGRGPSVHVQKPTLLVPQVGALI